MAIEFVCPTCNGTLQVSDEAAGRVIRCGGCLTMLRVPGSEPASSGGSASTASAAPTSPFETEPSAPPTRRPRPSQPTSRPNGSPRRRERTRDRDRDRDDYDDRYDDRYEDRPQRPRAEMPAPGRSVFLWVVGIGVVLFLVLLGCCAGMFAILPETKWQDHQSKDGGFTVKLPTKAKAQIEKDAKINLDRDTKAEGASMITQQYLVIYRTIKSSRDRANDNRLDETEADKKELSEAVDKLFRATNGVGKALEQDITVDGFPAREMTYKDRAGKIYTARVIIADTKRYIVLSCGILPEDNQNVRQFLESFHVTDENLIKKGKELEKQNEAKKKDQNNDE